MFVCGTFKSCKKSAVDSALILNRQIPKIRRQSVLNARNRVFVFRATSLYKLSSPCLIVILAAYSRLSNPTENMSDATKQDIPKSPISNGKSDFHPAPVYDVTKLQDSRTQRLKQLLDKGHITVAPLREPELILHSHLPHVRHLKRYNIYHRH